MATQAPVNKIIPLSVVDGPGNRTSVFLQGCNIACAYCHNPETQQMCSGCGNCIDTCPAGALSLQSTGVVWDESRCRGCDRCIATCPNHASPKVRNMSAEEVFAQIRRNIPFIRGITVSGGECMLRPEFLRELFVLCKGIGLSTLIDSNGTVDFERFPSLLAVCDGVMLDVKSWEDRTFRALTGHGNATVIKNISYLASEGKLEELRVVCLEGEVDVDNVLRGIASCIPSHIGTVPLKLIRFRKFGVRGRLEGRPSPSDEKMKEWKDLAASLGFARIVVK